jgi:YidC/Oxa1 family membrane protein insertase
MMKFYKENNVNPLGSCLPLVAQLPVFISLFYMLRQSLRVDICPAIQTAFQQHYAAVHHVSLHAAAGQTTQCGPNGGAGFLFVSDLTNKATGATLIVLIVLYVGTQLASSLMMSSATMERTQRQIMLVMPLFFVIFIINFPSGVIVYWITTNTWTMAQQYVIRRRIGPRIAPPAAAAAGGAGTSVVPPRIGPGKGGSDGEASSRDSGNGAGSGGLGSLIRSRMKGSDQKAAVATRAPAPPPRPPRKKKKRSGRRR